jgi:predicted transcriptional regulator
VISILAAQGEANAAEIATARSLGRSTVGKALVKLEIAGTVIRSEAEGSSSLGR